MTKQLEAPFYFSGVIDYDGECQQVSDGEAQFWTVYERNADGLSAAICDCYHRDDAVAATERFNALIAALEQLQCRVAELEASQLVVKLPRFSFFDDYSTAIEVLSACEEAIRDAGGRVEGDE